MSKFGYAIRGLLIGLRDSSIRLQWLIAIVVFLFYKWLNISLMEWMLVIVSCGVVIVAEYFNTVIERMMDFMHRNHHPNIEQIKDMSAGAVLVSALMALAVGIIIINSHIDKLLP